jgi:hypothetical protein
MHGCSDERGQTNDRVSLYIRTLVFSESLESHVMRFRAWDHWLRYTPAFEVFFELLDSRERQAF